jgi:hypothetical protein
VSVIRTTIYVTGSERIAVCVQATADNNTIAEVLCVLTVSALYKTTYGNDRALVKLEDSEYELSLYSSQTVNNLMCL